MVLGLRDIWSPNLTHPLVKPLAKPCSNPETEASEKSGAGGCCVPSLDRVAARVVSCFGCSRPCCCDEMMFLALSCVRCTSSSSHRHCDDCYHYCCYDSSDDVCDPYLDAGMVISCSSPPECPSSALLQVFWVSEGCSPGLTHIPSSLKHILAPDLLQTVRRPWDTVSAAWVIPGHFLLRRSGLVLTLGHINFASNACAVHTLRNCQNLSKHLLSR